MNGRGAGGAGRSLADRLDNSYPIEPYTGWEDHTPNLPGLDEVRRLMPPNEKPAYRGFGRFFLTRMIFSCLVDADRLATEAFYARAEGREPPTRSGTLQPWHLKQVRNRLTGESWADTEVNRLRSEILKYAVGKASLSPGFFTMTVPTGGGKTLTSLSFALEHALQHRKRRIIYVIPFTSIIEQTARVFREEIGLGDSVLEHHSSFDCDRLPSDDTEGEGAAGLEKLRRDAENWDAPIVVTTAVQFFESLFSRRPSKARKLHNLADSVIILDEVQTMPVKLLRPCMAALDELRSNYGASIILCTATQPALRLKDRALPLPKNGSPEGFDIDDGRELAPSPRDLYTKLRRVSVEWREGETDDATIADRFTEVSQMLCIVNSRAHAHDLFKAIKHLPGAYHLSTLMCARHRRERLETIRAALKAELPVRLVATSLIEAGVDVDFPEVWRAVAGLDAIAQAAGRCNREGLLSGMGRMVIFESANQKVPPDIEAFWQAAREPLRAAVQEGRDPLGLDTIHAYFKKLYFEKGWEALDKARLGKETYPILPAIADTAQALAFPFATISDAFKVIEETLEPVLVPHDEEAREALSALEHAPMPPAGILRKLQQYSVSVPPWVRRSLLESGSLQPIQPKLYGDRFLRLANESLYTPDMGLRIDDPMFRDASANIFN